MRLLCEDEVSELSRQIGSKRLMDKIIHTLQAGPSYVEAFVVVLRNVTKEDVVQYVLASLDDLISGTAMLSPREGQVCYFSALQRLLDKICSGALLTSRMDW